MGYLIIGFLLGVAVSWFWQRQFSDVPVFQKLMHKELAANGQLGSLTVLKKRLELMEKKVAELEKPEVEGIEKLEPAAEEKEGPNPEPDPTKKKDRQLSNVVRQIRSPERAIDRNQVLQLWNEGCQVAEIASRTRLGKGEIELIISMQENITGRLIKKTAR